jgi:DNA-binding NarL/FixJ family response regulator
VRILIADDHPIFREGLRKLLEVEPRYSVVGEAVDGDQAATLVHQLKPDLLLLDLSMPRVTGLDALRELARTGAAVRVVLLTAGGDRREIVQAVKLGAHGVVLKEAATALLFKCIDAVMAGEYWLGRDNASHLLRSVPADTAAHAPSDPLSAREREIVSAIAQGATNRAIGKQLGVSERTIETHVTEIFAKLGVSNRLELALYAVNRRRADPDPHDQP